MKYTQFCSSKKKKSKGKKEMGANPNLDYEAVFKAAYQKATKFMEAAKLTIAMEGAKSFKLYKNLLFNEARQQ